MKQLVGWLPSETIGVLDRGDDSTWFWCPCSALPHKGMVIRLKRNRCVSRPAPARTGTRGGPRNDGDTLRPDTEATPGSPDGQWDGLDEQERPVRLRWWKHLPLKEARSLDVTAMRVERPCASKTERDPRVSWVVWIGDPEADLVSIGLGTCCG